MKARLESGKVVKYSKIPSEWIGTKHYIGGFHNATTEEHETEGFFDVITPDYDSIIQQIDNLHFDEEQNAFVYDVNDKTISETVAELKEIKIKELKEMAYHKLSNTDWYAIRKAENGTDIPSDIQTERDTIRTDVATKEGEINALKTKASILKYDANL